VPERATVTDYTDIVPITSIRAAAPGETTTRKTFRLSTGGVTGKRIEQGVISGRCSIFLKLHGRIDPETRKSDPHHAGIKELPAAFAGTYSRRLRKESSL
jgi:hypothetical protein